MVSFDQQNGIVKIQISGESTKEDHYAARDEALRMCQEKRCSKLLVDLRKLNTKRFSVIGCFSFGESVSMKSPDVQIAHVLPKDTKSREDVKFTSTVEANRGKSTGEFETIEEAKNWLLQRT